MTEQPNKKMRMNDGSMRPRLPGVADILATIARESEAQQSSYPGPFPFVVAVRQPGQTPAEYFDALIRADKINQEFTHHR